MRRMQRQMPLAETPSAGWGLPVGIQCGETGTPILYLFFYCNYC